MEATRLNEFHACGQAHRPAPFRPLPITRATRAVSVVFLITH
jgi:hypothetical protein